jgi:putative tryptophan/tyrosine transport system substrate-binding protein
MRRRELIMLLGGAAAAWSVAARAQQPERVRRIGVLMSSAADDRYGYALSAAFAQGLQELGWSIGRNIRIDIHWTGGDVERIRKSTAELLALAPDVPPPPVGWPQPSRKWDPGALSSHSAARSR